MCDYIKREDIFKYPIRLSNYDENNGDLRFVLGIESVLDYIEHIPTRKIKSIKCGKWVPHGSLPTNMWHCSDCQGLVEVAHYCNECYYNFCPICGATMN